MHTPVFHFHNEHGIQFPSIGTGVREEGMFFRRFRGLIYPGRDSSIIGRGGSGVIHLVRDEIMDRVVALKLPNESILAEPQIRSEVLNEASQALELTHPNIVRIYDFHDQDGRWGISMQYVRGRNIDEWREKLAPHQMASGSFYDVDQIKPWILQLCEALTYAHEEAGIAHCDIKPRNLLLERSFDTRTRQIREKLLLTDFGITQKLRDFTTRTQRHNVFKSSPGADGDEGGAAGTLAYMSPQQLRGGESAISDDIYAVGITLYELLTGRPPFYQGDAKIIQHQIESVEPPLMMARRHERGVKSALPIPDLWEQVTAQCLHKDASKRPANARELARLLGLSSATVANISPAEERRKQQEMENLLNTVQDQESKLSSLTVRLRDLEASQAGKVDEAQLQEAQAQIEELQNNLFTKDAQLAELDEQLQDLEEEKNELQHKLSLADIAGTETVSKLDQEREALVARIQQTQADAARMKEERDTANNTLKKSQQTLDEINAKHAAALKEAADAASRAKTADARIKQIQETEAQTRRKLEEAQADVEKKLALTRQELDQARKKVDAATGAQTAPVKAVLMLLLGLMAVGGLIGALVGWLAGETGANEVAGLVQQVTQSADKAYLVKKKHVQVYLRQLGLADETLGDHFAKLPADAPATGMSWLEVAAFCDWLTQVTGRDASREWYDLPEIKDLNNLDPGERAGTMEWTREEGADRAIKAFNSNKPGEPQDRQRTERSPDMGFHCILRQKP